MSLALQYLINGLLAGLVYSTYAIGYTMVLTTSKFMHVCHAGVMAVAGLMVWYFYKCGMSLLPAVILGMLCGVVMGVLIEALVYNRLRKQHLPYLLTMIVSLGVMTIIQAALAMIFGTVIQYLPSKVALKSIVFNLLGHIYYIPGWQTVTLGITLVILLVMLLVMLKTRIGSEIQAVAANTEMAQLIGINLDKVYIVTMALASVLAAWVGASEMICHGLSPYGGTPFMLVGMVIRTLGGVRNYKGVMYAGIAYGLAENLVLLAVPSKWASPVAYMIFVIAILIRANPQRSALEKLGGGL